MEYVGYITGDKIEVIPTYRCQMDPILNSNIRDSNNPGKYYKPLDLINGIVINETLNGVWIMTNKQVRNFYEKDKYIFKVVPFFG